MDSVALYLKIFGIDEYHLQSLYWPRLDVCACMNQAKCSFNFLTSEQYIFSSKNFYLADCECTEGFTGRFCKQRVNMCQPNSCYYDNACSALSTSHMGYSCASCPEGLAGNGVKCGGM
ncbi:hypothetical protein NP493_700g01004 [Ridgeia piscesae]|uniref:EGF-like domain-containing protein n=1 Tax=Ridgeia piscesae TaxID=27915 RepID=A0AAD9KRC0_RIDPI|nr:hypothetical protein NP493_700g01004 [Ridgeia piscesae]